MFTKIRTVLFISITLTSHTPTSATHADRMSAIEKAMARIAVRTKKTDERELTGDVAIVVSNLIALIHTKPDK